MSTTLDTTSGARISLGAKIGEGGEGAVFEVCDRPDLVAKVYHHAVEPKKAAKLSLMARIATPALLEIAAWPTDVLTGRGRAVLGLLMPKVLSAREAHCLYSPKQRQQLYPKANWEFLAWAARNAAAAVDTVHAAGHVIGDINQKGFLIADDSRVRLIDCDSFQITTRSERHLCVVGVPEFTAPELLGKPFDQTIRTPNHDAFGLSVLIFHLLFMGRHPFAGRFTGSGDMPVDRAVRELRFAYSQRAASMQMAPPPHALPLTAASFPIASLFERAFSTDGLHGARPAAGEWVKALERLRKELKTCADDKAHVYHESLLRCPWCQIERGGGPAFFIAQITGDALKALDITRLTSLLNKLRLPTTVPQLPVAVPPKPVPTALPSTIGYRRGAAYLLGAGAGLLLLATFGGAASAIAALIALALGGVAIAVYPSKLLQQERDRRLEAKLQAERAWRQLTEGWLRDCSAALAKFHAKRVEIGRHLEELQGLSAARQKQLQKLHDERERFQKQLYLERFSVETAALSGIGPGLKAMLIAYGFETAHDITWAVGNVRGIGPVKLRTLLDWRRGLEARFRFDPAQGVSPAQQAAVDREVLQRRRELERLLAQAAHEFPVLHQRALALLSPDRRRFEQAARQLAQAQADVGLI